jgi:N-sulfoglucosamine sulfohydrolase
LQSMKEAQLSHTGDNMSGIVFITAHDLGRHLGCYGVDTVNSPHLDELAQQGVLFAQSFCTAPLCSPSRSALHTGRYSHANGVMGLSHTPFGWRLHPGEKHIAQRLREHGYYTALAGVQHLTKHPTELGYDVVRPLDSALQVGEDAAQILHSLHAEGKTNKPFYLEVGFFEPHRPYDWKGTVPDASKGITLPPYLPADPASNQEMAALQGSIQTMDRGIGIILDTLRTLNMEEDTWVIFTVDHGIAMPRAKCTLYDPGIETALLMRWPAQGLRGGITLSEMISNVDIVPTLLDGIGIPVPPEIQGRSFWSLLQGKAYQPRDEIFAEKTYHTYYEPMRCIRTADHKLILNLEIGSQVDVPNDIRRSPIYPLIIGEIANSRPLVELYDLEHDPLERVNIAGKQPTSALEKELRHRLLDWMRETGDPILQGPIPSPYYVKALEWLMQEEESQG